MSTWLRPPSTHNCPVCKAPVNWDGICRCPRCEWCGDLAAGCGCNQAEAAAQEAEAWNPAASLRPQPPLV